MKKNIIIITFILFTSAVVFTGCKKDKDNGPAERSISFHLHTVVGNTVANYTSVFTDATGRSFTLSDCRYYISNIVFIKDDGTELPMTGKVLLANPATMKYEIGKVPVGKYKGYRFLFGIDSVTNHSDPATYPSSSPLSYQNPTMHWGWNQGYIFMIMEGKVDTSAAGNGTPDFDFYYHIGLDQMKRTIDFSTTAFEVRSNEDTELGIVFDIRKVLDGVNIPLEYYTHTMDVLPLATKIADNIPSAFQPE